MSKRITRKQLQRIVQEERRIIQRKNLKLVASKKSQGKSNKQLAKEALDTGLYQLIIQEENNLFPNKLNKSRFTDNGLNEGPLSFLRDMKRKWDSMKGSVSSSMDAAKNMGKGFADMIDQFSDDRKKSALERAKSFIMKQMTPVIQKSTEEAIGALKKEYEKAGVEHTDESVKMEVMAALQGALGMAVKDSAEGAQKAAKAEAGAAKKEDKEQEDPSDQKDGEESDDGSGDGGDGGGGDTDTGSGDAGNATRLGDKIKSAF